MARLVEEVLHVWRLGERLLEELPPIDPDHETIRIHVAELREIYRELTESGASTRTRIAASEATLRRARASIDAANLRLSGSERESA